MKRCFRWICPIFFLSLCAIAIWFLHLFTIVDDTMLYINWQSSVQIKDDGSEQPFVSDGFSNATDLKGSYCFTAQLPEEIPSGCLLFETSGVSLSLSLNGTEIYQSSASLWENTPSMSQATIPLPEGATGELVYCQIVNHGNMCYDKRKMKVILWPENEPTKFFYQMKIRKS